MDRIKEMIDQLSEITDEQVSELQAEIISQFETVEKEDPTPQSVDAMVSLADMLDSVKIESKRREAAAQELAQRASDAATRVYGEDSEKDMEADSTEEKEEDMTSESEAAMHEDKEDEMPSEEVPSEEMPAVPSEEMDEEKKKEEEKMSEASTETEKAAELSTTEEIITETVAPVAVVEEPVVAAAEEVAVVAGAQVADALTTLATKSEVPPFIK